MKQYITLILSLLTFDSISANESILTFDYSRVDSIAINFNEDYSNDASYLAQKLTVNLETQHEKYRVIFRWISENIEYKRGRYGPDSETILKKGAAVCEGYSSLLKEMCEAVNIECKIIVGYSKTTPSSDIPLRLKKTDHAWSAVKLYDKWYLSDVTWATSKFNTDDREFIKEFDENYFISDPNFFLLKHYPEDKDWILTDTSFTKRDFKKGAVFYSNYLDFDFQDLKIPKGLVRRKIKVEFTTPVEITRASIGFKRSRDYIPIEVKNENGLSIIEYEFEKGDFGAFTIFLNGKAIWGFKKK